MKLLKIKAAIYRYTGIDLTAPEKLKYIKSVEFSHNLVKMKRADKSMSVKNIIGLLIGGWEAENGIYRSLPKNYFSVNSFSPLKDRIKMKLLCSFVNIKCDIVDNKKEVRKVVDVLVLTVFILIIVKLILSLRG